MANTKTKTSVKQEPKKEPDQKNDAAIVADMQRFFYVHGYYRAEDVHRILGDPSGGVTISTQSDLVFSKTSK